MQQFVKKPIAIAVSASMLAMAGSTYAAPVLRTTNPVVVTAFSGSAADLFSTTGANGTLNIGAFLTVSQTLAGATTPGLDGLVVNGGTAGTPSEQDIQIYSDDGTTKAYLAFSGVGVVASSAAASGTIKAAVTSATQSAIEINTLAPLAGSGAYRINAGKLEVTTDNTVAAPTWVPVKVALVGSTTTGNRLSDASGEAAAGFIGTAADVGTAIAPTPKVSTRDADANGLIDGMSVDTYAPLASLASTNLNLTTVAIGAIGGLQAISAGTAVPNTIGGTAPVQTVDITNPLTVAWTAGTTAQSAAAAAAPAYFNTGASSTGSVVPFAIDVKVGSEPSYTNVYRQDTGAAAALAANATGTASAAFAGAMPAPGTVTDAASPVLRSATVNSNGELEMVFSEPLNFIVNDASPMTDLREIAENVFIGTDALSALNLNAGGTLAVSLTAGAGADTNTDMLTVNPSTSMFAKDQVVTVTKGIGLAESNDDNYTGSATVLVQDDSATGYPGGLMSSSGTVEGASGSKTVVAPAVNVAFSDCKASAQTGAATPDKVAQIICAFPAGKEVAFATGKTVADLVNQVYVRVNGTGVGGNPTVWDFFPNATQMALDATGALLTITIPTPLIYANVPTVISMTLSYLNDGGAAPFATAPNVLVAKADATDVVDASNVSVIMPFAAGSLSNTLYTQSIKGIISDANTGSRLKVFIAKWNDKAVSGTTSASNPTSGKITNAGDKVATDLALMFSSVGGASSAAALGTAINTELAKDKPGLIPVYVQLQRSNDTKAAGGVSSGQGGEVGGGEHYLEARAIIAAVANSAEFTTQDPVYQVMLDPKTGNITGRLTGKLDFKSTTATKHPRGLVFFDQNGDLVNDSGNNATPVVAEGLIGAGGTFHMIVGVDSKTQGQRDYLKDAFLLMVLEDNANPGTFTLMSSADANAGNFVKFEPNLISLKGTRTDLGTMKVADVRKTSLTNTASWQLLGVGNANRKAPLDIKSVPRFFVGLDAGGLPGSNWTEDNYVGLKSTDLMLTMFASKTGLATEGTNNDTTGTLGAANYKANALAFAFASDNGGTSTYPNLFNLVKADDAPTGLPIGWSLIRVPTAAGAGWTTMPADVEMVINVGANAGTQYTWVKGDTGSAPAVAGKPVFVYAKKAVPGK